MHEPYGLIALVPAYADLDKVPGIEEWWHTDGIYIWRENGKRLTGIEAAQALQAAFEQAAKKLPFRAQGHVFFQTMDEKKYRLFAIDPGWLDPEDRNITILVQIARKNISVTDALSGERIKVNNGTLQIVVPAGAFRILEVVVH